MKSAGMGVRVSQQGCCSAHGRALQPAAAQDALRIICDDHFSPAWSDRRSRQGYIAALRVATPHITRTLTILLPAPTTIDTIMPGLFCLQQINGPRTGPATWQEYLLLQGLARPGFAGLRRNSACDTLQMKLWVLHPACQSPIPTPQSQLTDGATAQSNCSKCLPRAGPHTSTAPKGKQYVMK